MGNLVAIVGRPNVGKSTLFNKLTSSKSAIVHDVEGTTRDRQYGKAEWNGIEFSVVDTGGWIDKSDDVFEKQIKKQVKSAIEEADAIIFMVDVKSGLTDYDMDAAKILRQYQNITPVFLVANKADTFDWTYEASSFYSLGLGEPFALSAANGSGTGDFLDKLLDKLPVLEKAVLDELPKVAIVGRPNAGKSSMINAFFEEDKSIVTNLPGTTRDSIYTRFNKFGFDYYLIDTAGIRKKGKVNENLEYYSVLRSIKAIEVSDICVLMIDATRGIESQDLNIFSIIQKNRKGLVVCVNKWDLVEDKSNKSVKAFEDVIRKRFAPFVDFPIIFTSAINKQRVYKVLQTVKDVYDVRRQEISTNALNNFMLPLIIAYPPPSTKGKYVKTKYITQLKGTKCPGFVFFVNLPQYVKEPYKRFLENKIRSNWNFSGTPIMIFIRKK